MRNYINTPAQTPMFLRAFCSFVVSLPLSLIVSLSLSYSLILLLLSSSLFFSPSSSFSFSPPFLPFLSLPPSVSVRLSRYSSLPLCFPFSLPSSLPLSCSLGLCPQTVPEEANEKWVSAIMFFPNDHGCLSFDGTSAETEKQAAVPGGFLSEKNEKTCYSQWALNKLPDYISRFC